MIIGNEEELLRELKEEIDNGQEEESEVGQVGSKSRRDSFGDTSVGLRSAMDSRRENELEGSKS